MRKSRSDVITMAETGPKKKGKEKGSLHPALLEREGEKSAHLRKGKPTGKRRGLWEASGGRSLYYGELGGETSFPLKRKRATPGCSEGKILCQRSDSFFLKQISAKLFSQAHYAADLEKGKNVHGCLCAR